MYCVSHFKLLQISLLGNVTFKITLFLIYRKIPFVFVITNKLSPQTVLTVVFSLISFGFPAILLSTNIPNKNLLVVHMAV